MLSTKTENKDPETRSTFVIDGQKFNAPAIESALYVVSTPIGNLADITLRALQILASVDCIACEDTRVTRKLLDRYCINKQLIPYHEHNGEKQRPKILQRMKNNESIALVSDAGTPLISDPGYQLVNEVIDCEYKVVPIPGASALTTALVGSGLATDQFNFIGFLPSKQVARCKKLEELKFISSTLVFYESTKRIGSVLEDMVQIFGDDRKAVIARELTKKFETIERGTLKDLNKFIANDLKGEIVLLVGPPLVKTYSNSEIDQLLLQQLEIEPISVAATIVAKFSGRGKSEIYKRALKLKAK